MQKSIITMFDEADEQWKHQKFSMISLETFL